MCHNSIFKSSLSLIKKFSVAHESDLIKSFNKFSVELVADVVLDIVELILFLTESKNLFIVLFDNVSTISRLLESDVCGSLSF